MNASQNIGSRLFYASVTAPEQSLARGTQPVAKEIRIYHGSRSFRGATIWVHQDVLQGSAGGRDIVCFSAENKNDANKIKSLLTGMMGLAAGIARSPDGQRYMVQNSGEIFSIHTDDRNNIISSAIEHSSWGVPYMPLNLANHRLMEDRKRSAEAHLCAYLARQPAVS
ncbi:hypothetical protein ACL2XP_19110 [Sodalis sp. RH21]|uniref:hypothetical protein n=1 Tax=unclassified Sodalis (in: enterobacteria) TaxID=2636512 RepID=UPI0039B4F558